MMSASVPAWAAPRVVVPEGCGTAGPEHHHLSLTVGQESRELDDADCRALFRAAVVVSATIVLSATEPPAPSPARLAPAPPPPAPEPPRSEAPNRKKTFALGGAVGSGVSVGLVPQPTLALELSGRLVFAQTFGFGLAGQYVMSAARQNADGRGVTVDAWAGEPSGSTNRTHTF